MLVREFMHSGPVTIPPGTPLLEAEWRMQEGGSGTSRSSMGTSA